MRVSRQISQSSASLFPSAPGKNSQLDTDLENALPCSVIPVTKEEAENLRVKLGSLENTGVEEKTYAFTVDAGDTLTAEDTKDAVITAQYNDGTTDDIPIVWDYSTVDFYREGTYTITGQGETDGISGD